MYTPLSAHKSKKNTTIWVFAGRIVFFSQYHDFKYVSQQYANVKFILWYNASASSYQSVTGVSVGLPGCQCRRGKSSVGEDIYRADLKAVPDDGHPNSTKPTSTQIPLPTRIVMTFLLTLICLQSGICDGSLIYQLFKFRSEHIIEIQPIVASVFNRIKISSLNAALERHKKFFILRRNAGII